MTNSKRKSKFIILLVSLMLVFSAIPAFAADDNVHFSVPEVIEATVGDSITVPISIQLPASYEQSITGFGIRLNYDVEVLELTGVSVGDALGMLEKDIDSNYSLDPDLFNAYLQGYLQLAYAAVGQGLKGDGVVYNAIFEVKQRPASGSTPLTLTLREVPPGAPNDYDEQNIYNAVFVNGVVNIAALPADKSALTAAIDAVDYVVVSTDGSDVEPTDKWTTQAAKDAIDSAVAAAQAVVDKADATQVEVDDAVTALAEAVSAYEAAKQGGTKLSLVDNTIQGITPVRNAVAKTSVETAQYIANVEWSPALASGGKFADSTAYTATITVVPKAGYTLNGVPENYFSVQGAVSATNDTGSGVVTAIFPKTASASTGGGGGGGGGAVASTVTGIEIKAAPDKVSYDEGDKLDLAGLEVTVTYSDGTTKDIAAKDFAKNDITVSPKDGDVLDADVKAIEIKANGKTAKQVIVVEKKDIVTPPDIDEPVDKPVLTDIDGHWAQNYIDYLVGIGAISGYPDGTFRPDAPITRAEFAKVIVDAFELKGTGKVFDDTADHWAKNYVAIAAANGIVLGYNENEFGPDDLITREQMAIMIVKAAGLKEQSGVLDFIDEGNVSSWAYNWVVSAVDNNLMSGYEDNSFKPLNNATRAEAVTVIYNVLMK